VLIGLLTLFRTGKLFDFQNIQQPGQSVCWVTQSVTLGQVGSQVKSLCTVLVVFEADTRVVC